jgi:hypothetical protein
MKANGRVPGAKHLHNCDQHKFQYPPQITTPFPKSLASTTDVHQGSEYKVAVRLMNCVALYEVWSEMQINRCEHHKPHFHLHCREADLANWMERGPSFFHWLYSPRGPWPLLSVSWSFLQMVGLFGRVISSSQGLYLNTGQHKHRINTHTHQTSVPWVGFEPTIPASERAKTVHTLDRSAPVTGGTGSLGNK